jgi:hypothetical protein
MSDLLLREWVDDGNIAIATVDQSTLLAGASRNRNLQ